MNYPRQYFQVPGGGGNSNSVVKATNVDGSAIVDGFTVTGGNSLSSYIN